MTGPHLLAAVAYDEYYNDMPRMMNDIGKLLHQNFNRLVAAGCKHIQIDEPLFHHVRLMMRRSRAAVDAINLAIDGPPAAGPRSGAYLPGQLCGRRSIMTGRSATAISTPAATRQI